MPALPARHRSVGTSTAQAVRRQDHRADPVQQHRRTATGLNWTKTRVKALRISHGITAFGASAIETVGAEDHGARPPACVVTVVEAAQMRRQQIHPLPMTHRWLRDGSIIGEHAPRPGKSGSTSSYATDSVPTPKGFVLVVGDHEWDTRNGPYRWDGASRRPPVPCHEYFDYQGGRHRLSRA